MRPVRLLYGVIFLGVVLGAAVAFAWRPEIASISAPPRTAFEQTAIVQGAKLAALGNCITCHTRDRGQPFAGANPLKTPFGVIYATNITPDTETGIGGWSLAAFERAMRRGIDREGRHLYPAFPYDHFARLSDEDVAALYAYFMTRVPVRSVSPANELPFPLNVRMLMAGWNLLFLPREGFHFVAGHTPEWNRAAYLAEGVAHCGACHTPHNLAGAEKSEAAFAGGSIEGWMAPALDRSAPFSWSVDELYAYLRFGWDKAHGAAAGPMAPVVVNLRDVPEADVRAIAVYVASLGPKGKRPARPPSSVGSTTTNDGAAIFAGACAQCHDGTRPLPSGGIELWRGASLAAAESDNFLNVLLHGIRPADGTAGPLMPSFAASLNDAQMTVLAAYLRDVNGEPHWADLPKKLQERRAGAT